MAFNRALVMAADAALDKIGRLAANLTATFYSIKVRQTIIGSRICSQFQTFTGVANGAYVTVLPIASMPTPSIYKVAAMGNGSNSQLAVAYCFKRSGGAGIKSAATATHISIECDNTNGIRAKNSVGAGATLNTTFTRIF